MENKLYSTREILFRGKRTDNGEWAEGFFVQKKEKCYICTNPYQLMDGYSSEVGQHYGFGDFYEVDLKTVCQYTGLPDKNGRKIFEGDIVKLVLPDGEIRYFKVIIKSVVRKVLVHPGFENDFSKVEITGVVFEWNGYDLFPCVDTYKVPDYKMMEVIGNIFDNPDLIE